MRCPARAAGAERGNVRLRPPRSIGPAKPWLPPGSRPHGLPGQAPPASDTGTHLPPRRLRPGCAAASYPYGIPPAGGPRSTGARRRRGKPGPVRGPCRRRPDASRAGKQAPAARPRASPSPAPAKHGPPHDRGRQGTQLDPPGLPRGGTHPPPRRAPAPPPGAGRRPGVERPDGTTLRATHPPRTGLPPRYQPSPATHPLSSDAEGVPAVSGRCHRIG